MSILESYINNPSGEVFTIARESRSALVLSLCLPDTVEWSRSEGTINNQWMVSVLHKANFSDPEQTECSQETLLLGPTKNTRNHRDRVKRGLFILSIELYLHLNFMVLTLKSISVHVPNIWWVCKTVVVVVNFYNFIVGKKTNLFFSSHTKVLGSTSFPGKATWTELVMYILRYSVKYLMGTNGEEVGIVFLKKWINNWYFQEA